MIEYGWGGGEGGERVFVHMLVAGMEAKEGLGVLLIYLSFF